MNNSTTEDSLVFTSFSLRSEVLADIQIILVLFSCCDAASDVGHVFLCRIQLIDVVPHQELTLGCTTEHQVERSAVGNISVLING